MQWFDPASSETSVNQADERAHVRSGDSGISSLSLQVTGAGDLSDAEEVEELAVPHGEQGGGSADEGYGEHDPAACDSEGECANSESLYLKEDDTVEESNRNNAKRARIN